MSGSSDRRHRDTALPRNVANGSRNRQGCHATRRPRGRRSKGFVFLFKRNGRYLQRCGERRVKIARAGRNGTGVGGYFQVRCGWSRRYRRRRRSARDGRELYEDLLRSGNSRRTARHARGGVGAYYGANLDRYRVRALRRSFEDHYVHASVGASVTRSPGRERRGGQFSRRKGTHFRTKHFVKFLFLGENRPRRRSNGGNCRRVGEGWCPPTGPRDEGDLRHSPRNGMENGGKDGDFCGLARDRYAYRLFPHGGVARRQVRENLRRHVASARWEREGRRGHVTITRCERRRENGDSGRARGGYLLAPCLVRRGAYECERGRRPRRSRKEGCVNLEIYRVRVHFCVVQYGPR